jgi:hypothetical protein
MDVVAVAAMPPSNSATDVHPLSARSHASLLSDAAGPDIGRAHVDAMLARVAAMPLSTEVPTPQQS